MTQKFELGQVVMTRGVADWAAENEGHSLLVMKCLTLHHSGDWGTVDAEDWQANENALIHGDRLLSAYTIVGTKIWIITEADRSVTTVLFPSEY